MMRHRGWRPWLLLMLACSLLQGCATATLGEFEYKPHLTEGKPSELSWPAKEDGEVPRYLYVGEITGEDNFSKAKTRRSGAIRWLLDLLQGEAPPVVLQRPQSGITDESGRILVTDSSRQAVYVFDLLQGHLDIWEYAEGLVLFSSPTGIALGPEGEVYVADANLGLVARLNRQGEGKAAIGKGVLKRPIGVAFDAEQKLLYVADTYAHDIKVFDLEGRLVNTLGQRGSGTGEFNFPTYIALNQHELYVVDTMEARIQVVDPSSGSVLRVIGERGTHIGNLVRPKGLALDSEGNVYVVESYHDHLLIYNKKGEFLLPIGGTGKAPGNFYLPSGVWIDAKDRVYVADMFNGRISVFQFLGGGQESE